MADSGIDLNLNSSACRSAANGDVNANETISNFEHLNAPSPQTTAKSGGSKRVVGSRSNAFVFLHSSLIFLSH